MVIFSGRWVLDHLHNSWKGLLCVRDFRLPVGKCKPTFPAFTPVAVLWNITERQLSVPLPAIVHIPLSICVLQTCLTGCCIVNYHTNTRLWTFTWQKIVKEVQTQALYVGAESWTKVITALCAEDTGRGLQGWYNILPVSLREQGGPTGLRVELALGMCPFQTEYGELSIFPCKFHTTYQKKEHTLPRNSMHNFKRIFHLGIFGDGVFRDCYFTYI